MGFYKLPGLLNANELAAIYKRLTTFQETGQAWDRAIFENVPSEELELRAAAGEQASSDFFSNAEDDIFALLEHVASLEEEMGEPSIWKTM